MEIPKSTYCYRPRTKLEKQKYSTDIADKIEAIGYDFPSYGYRRITAALKRQGMVVNHKKVAKIMKNIGISCRRRKRFVSTTNPNHSLKTYPNLAKDTVVNRTNKLWCADITYIRILTAFVYLAAIIDAFSRKIVCGICYWPWLQNLPWGL